VKDMREDMGKDKREGYEEGQIMDMCNKNSITGV
jgi:hypothetical protein